MSLETLTWGEAFMMGLDALNQNQEAFFQSGATVAIAYVTVRAAARVTRALNEWIERSRVAYEERRLQRQEQRYREKYEEYEKYAEYEEYEDYEECGNYED